MLAVSTTGWWTIGFVVGGAVVVVAATLLVVIIALATRIERRAREICDALDGAIESTAPLFEFAHVNHTIESLTRGVKEARGEQGQEDERGLLQRLAGLLPGGSGA